ncbi:MAG TPA: serine O-acetyltransferase [Rhizomicrobium sp.]|jgi:serine O-acetyltransferase|nr:serine O-acetyltransferase [Rhizomicrobium sp.]
MSALPSEKIASCDPIWSAMRTEAEHMAAGETALASYVHATILNHERLEEALAYHLAKKVGADDLSPMMAREIFEDVLKADPAIGQSVRADLSAIFERDPACHSYAQAFLFFKGFHAVQTYRIAHWLWTNRRAPLALFLQSRMSEIFAIDIHPAAVIGKGIMIDHGTGVVVGETAVIEDDVSMLHGVTLGGTGKEEGDRHPKVRRGVLLSAGVKVLGNIEIGEYSRVGAGSVVLKAVPPHCTVAGVPAKIIGCQDCERPSHEMNQIIEMDFQI